MLTRPAASQKRNVIKKKNNILNTRVLRHPYTHAYDTFIGRHLLICSCFTIIFFFDLMFHRLVYDINNNFNKIYSFM